MILPLAALLVGVVALDCEPAGDWPLAGFDEDRCPQVYRVHGTADVDRALNVVLLPDAFAADDLDDFRCASALLVEKLVAMPPFNEYSDALNVFRVDLASSSSGVEFPDLCGGVKCHHPAPVWEDTHDQGARVAARHPESGETFGRPVLAPERPACMAMDLDARACPQTAQECQVLWPEGQGLRRLWRVAACAPAFDVVVVVANSGAQAGGGVADMHPPLSVTTLNGIGNWTTRSRLMAHEFGHSLGLLDEYPVSQAYSGRDQDLPPFHDHRNVMKAIDGRPPEPIPWADDCTPATGDAVANGRCDLICACGDCEPIDPAALPATGVYEGGFYSECGFYRASNVCAMKAIEDPLCVACAGYVHGLFEDLGMEPNAGGPNPTGNPDAGPASP